MSTMQPDDSDERGPTGEDRLRARNVAPGGTATRTGETQQRGTSGAAKSGKGDDAIFARRGPLAPSATGADARSDTPFSASTGFTRVPRDTLKDVLRMLEEDRIQCPLLKWDLVDAGFERAAADIAQVLAGVDRAGALAALRATLAERLYHGGALLRARLGMILRARQNRSRSLTDP